jgi:hypothetical protein
LTVAIFIGIALAASSGNILYGLLAGLAWGFFAHSLGGIVFTLLVIGGIGALFGISS